MFALVKTYFESYTTECRSHSRIAYKKMAEQNERISNHWLCLDVPRTESIDMGQNRSAKKRKTTSNKRA